MLLGCKGKLVKYFQLHLIYYKFHFNIYPAALRNTRVKLQNRFSTQQPSIGDDKEVGEWRKAEKGLKQHSG